MKVVITGGTGMLGRRLALRILAKPELVGPDGVARDVDELVLFDAFDPVELPPVDPRVSIVTGDISDRATVDALIDVKTDAVFHFAAVVSGGAEADFDLGYAVNLDGGRNVLEAARRTGRCPRIVFTSSLAVYGGERSVTDATALTPQTSYGTQKAIGELMVNDYTRKGFVDGRTLRLPTIVIRPGKPNAAASGFASSILREPLQGDDVGNPVTPDSRMLILSPKRAVQAFIDIHNADGESPGYEPCGDDERDFSEDFGNARRVARLCRERGVRAGAVRAGRADSGNCRWLGVVLRWCPRPGAGHETGCRSAGDHRDVRGRRTRWEICGRGLGVEFQQ